jgi:hypothetical protein
MKRSLLPHRVRWQIVAIILGVWLTGCSLIQAPTPTLVPTLTSTPLPSATPSPIPATVVPPTATPSVVWRSKTLETLQSFDFRQDTTGAITDGDLYFIASDSHQSSACFWANNGEQVGGRDLGSWPQTSLARDPLPQDRYSGECIAVIGGHAYVYGLRDDARLVVLRVVETGATWVTFEYILRE